MPIQMFFSFLVQFYVFISDAICLVSDHLPVDIFRLSVSNSTIVSDFILTKLSNTPQLFLLRRLNLSCYFLMIVLMTVSNFFLLLNKVPYVRLKSPTIILWVQYKPKSDCRNVGSAPHYRHFQSNVILHLRLWCRNTLKFFSVYSVDLFSYQMPLHPEEQYS